MHTPICHIFGHGSWPEEFQFIFLIMFPSYLLILQSSDGDGVGFKAASKGNSANTVSNRQASV